MKLTRFYLRQNLEPLGNVCICVGGLPTGLESTKYQDLLSDILGESKYPLFKVSVARLSQILVFSSLNFLLDLLSFHSECYKLSSLYFLQRYSIVKWKVCVQVMVSPTAIFYHDAKKTYWNWNALKTALSRSIILSGQPVTFRTYELILKLSTSHCLTQWSFSLLYRHVICIFSRGWCSSRCCT